MTSREERIRQRAFDLWEQAGKPTGRDDEFWFSAEAEIRAEDDAHPDPMPPRGGMGR